MIKVLGSKRIIILIVLLAANLLFGFLAYMHFKPQEQIKERELRSMRSQTATLQTDIDGLMIEFEQLDEQREAFEQIKQDGFFDGQSRRKAELIFKKIQERSGVISAVASVNAGSFEDNQEAAKANHTILKSPISIRIEAVNDLDVFRYIYLVNEFFPGHVAINQINLEREASVTGTVLRAVASGKSPPLVVADLQLSWRTMIPDTQSTQGRP